MQIFAYMKNIAYLCTIKIKEILTTKIYNYDNYKKHPANQHNK